MTQQQKPPLPEPAVRTRPLHTRKSAWKLGWPTPRLRPTAKAIAEPAPG